MSKPGKTGCSPWITAAVSSVAALAAIAALAVSVAGAAVSHSTRRRGGSCVGDSNGHAGPGHFRFQTSACENSTSTVATFPLRRGTSGGQRVYYVVTDVSNRASARRLGVNYVPKLRNALGTSAVMRVTRNPDGTLNFPATVRFGLKKVLVPGPGGFPPAKFSPSAMGAPNYSPLIELPNGVVMNAPQIANNTGRALKVVSLNTRTMKVRYVETEGRYEGKHIHYVSFDSSNPVAATIENMTYAPALGAAPKQGNEGLHSSSRETLGAFVNGATGRHEPERQGINSTILDGLDPHNILDEVPALAHHPDVGDITYAPMWDVHLIQWTKFAIQAGDRIELRSVFEIELYLAHGAFACHQGQQQCRQGLVQGVGGKILTPRDFISGGASGIVVNCPLVSIDIPK